MRTGVSASGCTPAGKEAHTVSRRARDIADVAGLRSASYPSYWYHYSHNGERFSRKPIDIPSAAISRICRMVKSQPKAGKRRCIFRWCCGAEHEFNASTFTSRVIAGTGSDVFPRLSARLAAARPENTAEANEVSLEIQQRYGTDEAEAMVRKRGKQYAVIGFGHPESLHHRRPAPSGNRLNGWRNSFQKKASKMHHIAAIVWKRRCGRPKDVPESRLVFGAPTT